MDASAKSTAFMSRLDWIGCRFVSKKQETWLFGLKVRWAGFVLLLGMVNVTSSRTFSMLIPTALSRNDYSVNHDLNRHRSVSSIMNTLLGYCLGVAARGTSTLSSSTTGRKWTRGLVCHPREANDASVPSRKCRTTSTPTCPQLNTRALPQFTP